MRTPKPTDSEKKAWPNAALHIIGSERTVKSGVKKKRNPSPKPERVIAKTANAIKMIIEKGTRIVDSRSIPFFTPKETTMPVIAAAIIK